VNSSTGFVAQIMCFVILAAAISAVGRTEPSGDVAGCAAATREEAKWLADELARQGRYRKAGECYQSAGDLADADKAFIKAAGAESDAAAGDLNRQSTAAKALFMKVQQAFRSSH
jgi:hypothetical protein